MRRLLPAMLLLAACFSLPVRGDDEDAPAPVNSGTAGSRPLFAPPVRDGFSFLIFGDRTTGRTPGLANLDRAIDVANRLDPDFVMTIGDMVQGYTGPQRWLAQMKEYREHIAKLRPPWYPVAGNHDVLGGRKHKRGNADLYAEHFGPLYYSFDYRWGHFISLWSEESVSQTSPTGKGRLSDEQIAWLEDDLKNTSAEQVYVFLHHPRWRYRTSNWDRVHELLRADGRVKAVFAGHLHQYRDDGVRDGIHYYVLAVTGGGQSAFVQTAGLHHIHLVRVRRKGFGVIVLPMGTVVGSDAVLGSELDRMNSLRSGSWLSVAGTVEIPFEGETCSELRAVLANPTDRQAACELEWKLPEGYVAEPSHLATVLQPGERVEETVAIRGPGFSEELPGISLGGTLFFRMQSGLVQPIHHQQVVPTRLTEVPRSRRSAAGNNRALVLQGKSAVRLPPIEPEGPMTLECWVCGPEPSGRRALVAHNERSSYGLFWSYDKEALPYFALGVQKVPGGRGAGYVSVRSKERWDFKVWTHLALSWDETSARFFVGGKLAEKRAAPGPRTTNRLPLFVGADPNSKGQPGSFFVGAIDEVRLSKTARYTKNFKPKEVFSPDRNTLLLLHFDQDDGRFFADDSGEENHGWPVGKPKFSEDAR